MSIECEDEGGIEYLDEILVFSEEANIDDDFMEFSKEILSIEEYDPWQRLKSSESSSGSEAPRGYAETGTKPLSSPRTPGASKDKDKKRKKQFVPGKHTSVTKNDVRKKYAQTYIDALNSGNVPIFKKSLRDIAIPEVILVTKNISRTGMYLPSHVETHGLEAISVFYDAFIKSTPDCAFELHSSTIRVFSDGTSSIICKYTMNATKVFALAGLEEGGDQKVVLSLDPMDELTQKFGRAQLNASVTTTVDDPVTGLQTEVLTQVKVAVGEVHKNKSKLAIFGTINLFLNTDKKVFRIDFTMSDLNEQREREKLQLQQLQAEDGAACEGVKCDESSSVISVGSSCSGGSSSVL